VPLSRPLVAGTALAASALVGAAAALVAARHPVVLDPLVPAVALAHAGAAPVPRFDEVAPEPALVDDLVVDETVDETSVAEPGYDEGRVDDATTADGLPDLATAADPVGTPAAIALRFAQALQSGEDLVAARQLAWQERLKLSRSDPWVLARVMRDVRRHAGLDGRSPCRHARPYDETSVLVACGPVRVLVKVDPTGLGGNGVLVLSGAARDRYRHDHTFAFSTVAV
jgi:hypothetical protein